MKKYFPLLLLLILPAIAPLFQRGYFAMHDDLQSMRQLEMAKCFSDLQIPCRWVLDMGYGYGYPLFNYYPPLPYLIGQPLRLLHLQYIDIVKVVGILGFIVCSLNMYLLAREFWGDWGGVVSSVFYTYAPYHSVDFYVRGAMDEFWAMGWYPLVFWSTYRLIKDRKWPWIPLVALSVAFLMLSHNPMLMIFTPFYLVWVFLWLIKFKAFKTFPFLALSAVFALGLAAFFTLPVLFETKYVSVWTLTSGYFNYLAHFVPLSRMFLVVKWGYGASGLGQTDFLSFHLGYMQWIIPGLVLLLLPFTRKNLQQKSLIIFLLFVALASLFMMHSKSTFIWQHIPPLAFLQFPWRFLTLAVFALSFLSGAIVPALPQKIITASLLGLVILTNGNYFQPRVWYPDMTDATKFTGKSWQLLITSGIFDYLPLTAKAPPADAAGSDLGITHGSGVTATLDKRTNYQHFAVGILSPTATIEIQTYYFPGWQVFVDGKEVAIDPRRDPLLGRMQIDLTSGRHDIVARFTNTPVRSLADALSAVSWAVLVGIMILWILRILRWGTLTYPPSKSDHSRA